MVQLAIPKNVSVLQKLSKLSDESSDALAKKLVRNLGNLKQYKVTKNYVLVGLYIGGKTHAGTHIIRVNINEDVYQSRCGVVIKLGPTAFKNDDFSNEKDAPIVGEWIYYRGGIQRMQINGMDYAYLHEDDIVGTISDPAILTHNR